MAQDLQTCKMYVLNVEQPEGAPNKTFEDEIIALSGALFRSDDSRFVNHHNVMFCSTHSV